MMHQAHHPSSSPPLCCCLMQHIDRQGQAAGSCNSSFSAASKVLWILICKLLHKGWHTLFCCFGFVWDLLQPLSEQLSHIQKATNKLRPCAISLHLGRERAVQSLWVAEEKSFRETSKGARVQECKKLNGIEWVFVVWVLFCESELGSCVGAC